jgi:hypothetical protein
MQDTMSEDSAMSKTATIYDEQREMLAVQAGYVFGERWKSELSRALDVDVRTVTRWDGGETLMARSYWDILRKLVVEKAKNGPSQVSALDRFLKRMERQSAR